jgi:ABC-type microcin C transport system permease subunit YejE
MKEDTNNKLKVKEKSNKEKEKTFFLLLLLFVLFCLTLGQELIKNSKVK